MCLRLATAAAVLALAVAVYPDCPSQPEGCTGTSESRSSAARKRARDVDLNRDWPEVREAVVNACGLKVQTSTSHCFEDFNHVDCCTMGTGVSQNTNEKSRVRGMHAVNFLGAHITDASTPFPEEADEGGGGGSWCTCHLSSPEDVCHKQFGARTAFKLVWCHGTGVAALLDDYGNVLSTGKPLSAGGDVPRYGGERARQESWQVGAG